MYDEKLRKKEDIEEIRNKLFDEMLYKLDDSICQFNEAIELMQKVAKDYKGYDFTEELNSHLLEEMGE